MLLVSQPEAFALPCTSKTSNAEAHADMYKDTHAIAPMFSHRSATAVVSNCIYIPIGIYSCFNPDLYMEFAKFPVVKMKRM